MGRVLFIATVAFVAAACGGGDRAANETPAAPSIAAPTAMSEASLPLRPDQRAIYVMNADGSGLRQLFAEGDYLTFAVPPDGGRIAVAANNADRTSDLYLIDPESRDRERVEHVDGALYVGDWSPDGNWLSISRQDDGGPTLELYSTDSGEVMPAGAGNLYSSEWTADSSSLYVGTNDATNGQRISLPDLESHTIDIPENFDRAAVSPDGDRLAIGSWLISATSSNTNGYVISLAKPDGSEANELARLPGNSYVVGTMAWSSDGSKLAYGWAGINSNATPGVSGLDTGVFVIDVASGETTRVSNATEGVDMGFSWSPDSKSVIIHRGVCTQCDGPGSKELLATADGSSTLDLPGTEQFQFSDGAWSPDGASFAYSGDRLYVADADGSNVRTLADMPNSAYQQIAWSDDGEQVYFQRSAALGNSLYAMDPDGTDIEALPAPQGVNSLTIAPDGETFAGVTQEPGLVMSKADGSTVQVRGAGLDDIDDNQVYSAAFTWSPDGDHVAIELGEKGETVAIADLSGDATVIDTPNKGGPVRWSPDSSQLAYWADGVIWAVGVDGGSPRRVADADVVPLDWSPDGSELVFVQAGNVVRAPSDGSGTPRVLFPASVGGLGTIRVRWSPDGDRIAVSGGAKLLVGPADGGSTTELVSISTVEAFEWSSDSSSIVYSGVRTVTEFSSEGGVFVVDADGGEPLLIVQTNTRYVRLLGPLADGRFVVATEFRI